MVFDFAARPPEVNSTLMYSGAGAGPMTAAASTFSNLSSELATNAAAYESVIQELGSEWTGPSSTAMVASAQQSINWLNTTSAQLQEAAVKAAASAAAYEAAFSATIPPPVVFANRAQLAALVATNILGQNTPAIAANEAMYGEFWAQDATAMSTYAANAAMAAQVTPLTEPIQNTNPGGSAAQSAAVSNAASGAGTNAGLHGLLGGLQSTASSAAVPAASAAAAGPTTLMGALQQFFGIGAVVDTVNTVNVTGSWFLFIGMSAIPLLSHFVAGAPFGFTMGDATPLGAGLGFGTTLASAESGVGGAAMAGMGSAANVGGMSVPAGWSAAAPAGAAETTLAGTGWTASVDEAATGMGGGGMNGVMPGMAAAGGKGGMGIGGPRYGVKPKVMPKQVFV